MDPFIFRDKLFYVGFGSIFQFVIENYNSFLFKLWKVFS